MEISKKTRTTWLSLIRDWESSGQSQRAFCEAHALKLGTFSYWRSQYLQSLGANASPTSGFTSLIPSEPVGRVRLRLGGLEVELSSDAAFVSEVLLRLSSSC